MRHIMYKIQTTTIKVHIDRIDAIELVAARFRAYTLVVPVAETISLAKPPWGLLEEVGGSIELAT